MKVNRTISVDADSWGFVQSKVPNISSFINDYIMKCASEKAILNPKPVETSFISGFMARVGMKNIFTPEGIKVFNNLKAKYFEYDSKIRFKALTQAAKELDVNPKYATPEDDIKIYSKALEILQKAPPTPPEKGV